MLNSGSELTLTGEDTDTVTISSGMLVGGAILSLTVTDDFGASSQTLVNVPFTGVNCAPLQEVYAAWRLISVLQTAAEAAAFKALRTVDRPAQISRVFLKNKSKKLVNLLQQLILLKIYHNLMTR